MQALRRAPIIGRHLVASVVVIVLVLGLLTVFAGTLTRSTDTEAQAERVRAEIAALERRVLEGEAELAFIESEAYLRWAARLHGYGEAGEHAFALPAGAPDPEPITPIGPQEQDVPLAPFDAWMELLFGGA